MSDILNKKTELVLNRNWQAIGVRTLGGKKVNWRKGNRLPHDAGLKLLSAPRAPNDLPVTALIRNGHRIAERSRGGVLKLGDRATKLAFIINIEKLINRN